MFQYVSSVFENVQFRGDDDGNKTNCSKMTEKIYMKRERKEEKEN